MTTKTKLIIAAVSLLTAFAFGRYSAPTYQKTEKEQSENTDTSTKKKVTVVETERPDGTHEKKTIIERDEDKKTSKDTKESEEIKRDGARVTISALSGYNFSAPSVMPFGVAITKPILGPVTAGLFYLSPTIVGVSLGLTF